MSYGVRSTDEPLFFFSLHLWRCSWGVRRLTNSFVLWLLPNFAQDSTTFNKHVADTAHLTITTLMWTAETAAPCPQTAPISSTSAVRVPLRRHTLIGTGSTTHKHSTENRQRCSSQGDSCLLPSTCHRVAVWVSKISIRKILGPKVCIQLDSPFILIIKLDFHWKQVAVAGWTFLMSHRMNHQYKERMQVDHRFTDTMRQFVRSLSRIFVTLKTCTSKIITQGAVCFNTK